MIQKDKKTEIYLRMPACAAIFPASPALPSSMMTSSALPSSAPSLERIFPP